MIVQTDCAQCGCRDVFLRKKGNATGLYCDGCGRWYQWVGKKDLESYTRRGFKVFPENYEPPHLSASVAPTQQSTQLIGVPLGQEDTSDREEQFVPPMDSIQRRNPLSQNAPFESEEPVVSANPLQRHQPVPENLSNFDPCPVCASGVLDPVSKADDTSASIFQGVLSVHSRDNTRFFGAYKLKYCPECGVKL